MTLNNSRLRQGSIRQIGSFLKCLNLSENIKTQIDKLTRRLITVSKLIDLKDLLY